MEGIIFGVDLVKGSPRGKLSPGYAVYIMNDIEKTFRSVSLFKLLRLIRKFRPSILAVDNIYELAENKRELISLMKRFPENTKLIQVTSYAGGESLTSLARRYGIECDSRNPLDEARACAFLASLGVGYEVSAFTEFSCLTVTRNRSLGKGGWSQNRYRRKVHHSVMRAVREIEDKLKTANIDYSVDRRKAFGGLSKGIFRIYAPMEKIPVKSMKTKDIQIKLEAVEKDNIEFIPLKKIEKYLIVGMDPGTTTAIAILDLNGNLIELKSERNWSLSRIIEFLKDRGRPVVVSTDVAPPPGTVLKLKKSFDAILHVPKESLTVERKNEITSGYATSNAHERDALAAAIEGYSFFRSKFTQIEKKVPPGVDVDEVKVRVLRGSTIKSAILTENVEEEDRKKKERYRLEDIQKLRAELRRKDEIITELEKIIERMKTEMDEKDRTISDLERRLIRSKKEESYRLRKEKEIEEKEKVITILQNKLEKQKKEIRDLNNKIQMMRKFRYLELKGEWKPIKVMRQFTRDEIEKLDSSIGIRSGDIILLNDPSGGGASTAELLVKKGIKAVIVENDMSHIALERLIEEEIPVIRASELNIRQIDDFAIVKKSELEEKYRNALKEVKKKRQKLSVSRLEKLFEEYRSERVRDM